MPQHGCQNAVLREVRHVGENEISGKEAQPPAQRDHRDVHRPEGRNDPKEWQMPQCPNRKESQSTTPWSEDMLEPWQGISAPSDLFAEAVREEGNDEHRRKPKPRHARVRVQCLQLERLPHQGRDDRNNAKDDQR